MDWSSHWSPKSGAEFVPPPLKLGRHPSCPDDEDWRCFLSSQSLKKYIPYNISYIDWFLWIRYHFKLITFYFCESHISILCESKKCITIINVQQWMMEIFWILETLGNTSRLCKEQSYNQYYNHVFACGLVTVPQIHTSASDSLGWGGVGWGGMITSLALPHDLDATLYDLHWQFHMILMLRSMIFNCHCTHPHPIVWGGVGWGGVWWDDNVIGISTWSWCYALWSSLAIPHDLDATLYDLHWQFHMILMLRSMIFIGNSTWSWCYALWSSLAIPHDLNATLYDLQLPMHTSASDSLGWGGVGW